MMPVSFSQTSSISTLKNPAKVEVPVHTDVTYCAVGMAQWMHSKVMLFHVDNSSYLFSLFHECSSNSAVLLECIFIYFYGSPPNDGLLMYLVKAVPVK